jgi:ribose-phosphate pyrophosphokinase
MLFILFKRIRGMEKYLLVSPNCFDLAEPNVEIKKFHDCENYIYIPGIEKLKEKHVVILHRCYPDQDTRIMQFLQILSAVRPFASKITAIIPYLPYSRQDEISRIGETDSATMIVKLLSSAGLDELITFNCHFIESGDIKKNVAGLNIENRSIVPDLLDYVKPRVSNPVIIAPDQGAAHFVEKLGGISMEKTLGEYIHGPLAFRQITSEKLDADIASRDVILIDDMIISGETMVKAVQVCKKGGARRIICASVHGLLVGCAFDRIRAAGAKEVVVSDSVPSPAGVVSIKKRLKDILQ